MFTHSHRTVSSDVHVCTHMLTVHCHRQKGVLSRDPWKRHFIPKPFLSSLRCRLHFCVKFYSTQPASFRIHPLPCWASGLALWGNTDEADLSTGRGGAGGGGVGRGWGMQASWLVWRQLFPECVHRQCPQGHSAPLGPVRKSSEHVSEGLGG